MTAVAAPLPFAPHRLSYVNDANLGIIKDTIGAEPPNRESRVDRRTACLNQANAFREKALADPEHHDQWIDEAIKWLERAMEASRRVSVTVEAGDGYSIPLDSAAAQRVAGPSERLAKL